MAGSLNSCLTAGIINSTQVKMDGIFEFTPIGLNGESQVEIYKFKPTILMSIHYLG